MANDTKERIAVEALRLFSKYGFAGVSIRDICKATGVKESTIYYHYINKQAILDELFRRVDEFAGMRENEFNSAFDKAVTVTEEEMVYVATHLLDDYFLNPYIFPLISMLAMERVHDKVADQKYRKVLFEMPLEQHEKVFSKMMERGFIHSDDPKTIATIYFGIIYSAFSQFCLGDSHIENDIEKAHKYIDSGIRYFYQQIKC